jgi:branched-chain amino acid transport system substrate-binding protein
LSDVERKKASRRKFLKYAGAGIVVVAAAAAGYGAYQYYAQPPTPRPTEKKPIVLGGSLPLTGAMADPAKWIKIAREIWAEEVNARGGLLGRPVELIQYDDELKSEKVVSLTEKLISVDGIDILIGPYPGPATPVVAPIADKYQKVTLHCFPPRSFIIGMRDQPDKFIYSFGFSSGTLYPMGIVDLMVSMPNEVRPKTLALVGRNDIYGRDSSETFRDYGVSKGFQIVLDEYYDPAVVDLSPLMRKVKDANPDGVMLESFMGDCILGVKALHDVGFIPKIVWGSVGPAVTDWIPTLEKKGSYVIGTSPYVHSVRTPGNDKLRQIIRTRYNTETHYGAGFGYMQMQIYEQAITNAGSLDQDKIREVMNKSEFETIMGPLRFGAVKPNDRYSTALLFDTQVLNDNIEVVYPYSYKTTDYKYPIPSNWGK